MSEVQLYLKLNQLTPKLKKELNDFIDTLLKKQKKNQKKKTPVYGSLKGKIKMSKDFDEPLDDFKEYMY